MSDSAARPPLSLPDVTPLTVPEGFEAELAAAGIAVAAPVLAAQGHFLALLLAMNTRMNLTAVVSPDEAWRRHTLDALTLLPLLEALPAGARVADVGSGGGVPALPLALCRPDLHVTLIESTQKKAQFLRDAAAALGLRRVKVLPQRAETVARGPLREHFDAVTARAVARLDALVPWTVPLVKVGGVALLIKGQRADEELAEAAGSVARSGAAHRTTVDTPSGRVVVLEKRRRTPADMPALR